jgi:hypothetical protein
MDVAPPPPAMWCLLYLKKWKNRKDASGLLSEALFTNPDPDDLLLMW